jgi:hypothetical protein
MKWFFFYPHTLFIMTLLTRAESQNQPSACQCHLQKNGIRERMSSKVNQTRSTCVLSHMLFQSLCLSFASLNTDFGSGPSPIPFCVGFGQGEALVKELLVQGQPAMLLLGPWWGRTSWWGSVVEQEAEDELDFKSKLLIMAHWLSFFRVRV